MTTNLAKVLIFGLVIAMASAPESHAGKRKFGFGAGISMSQSVQLVEGGELPISPSEAASIAQNLVPNAEVLKVKLLPGDKYAVTLRGDGKLTRIEVDGVTGVAN